MSGDRRRPRHDEIYCPNCGAIIREDVEVCPECDAANEVARARAGKRDGHREERGEAGRGYGSARRDPGGAGDWDDPAGEDGREWDDPPGVMDDRQRPDSTIGKGGYMAIGIGSAVISLIFVPILFGPIAIFAGVQLHRKWEGNAGIAVAGLGVVCMIAGMIIGVLVATSMAT